MWLSSKESTCNAGDKETQIWSPGQEDPLEKEMATHSSILAWETSQTEEAGRLQSMMSERVRHNWARMQTGATNRWMHSQLRSSNLGQLTEGRCNDFRSEIICDCGYELFTVRKNRRGSLGHDEKNVCLSNLLSSLDLKNISLLWF